MSPHVTLLSLEADHLTDEIWCATFWSFLPWRLRLWFGTLQIDRAQPILWGFVAAVPHSESQNLLAHSISGVNSTWGWLHSFAINSTNPGVIFIKHATHNDEEILICLTLLRCHSAQHTVKRIKLEVLILVAWALLVWYFEGQLQVGTSGEPMQNEIRWAPRITFTFYLVSSHDALHSWTTLPFRSWEWYSFIQRCTLSSWPCKCSETVSGTPRPARQQSLFRVL